MAIKQQIKFKDPINFEGDKMAIQFMHLGNALAPSYKQFVRLAQAATETPTARGDVLDVGPEIAGFKFLQMNEN